LAHRRKPTAVALFAGAGGLSQGFIDAGFDVVFATDNDKSASSTYQANHPNTIFLQANAFDPKELSGETIFQSTGLKPGDIDVVFGGPPCRGFSMGNRQNGGLKNPHNALVLEFVRLVQEIQPRWFVMENVAGLWYMDQGKMRKELIEKFECAYIIKAGILNAADFGVPQVRRRALFVGTSDSIEFVFPTPTYGEPTLENTEPKPHITVGEAIGDLPSLKNSYGKKEMKHRRKPRTEYQILMRGESERVLNHLITRSNKGVIERYRHIGQGENWSSLSDAMIAKWRKVSVKHVRLVSHSNLYLRLDPSEPSPTVGNFRKSMFIHPDEDRGLSVREAARLQSFPDWYEFKGGLHSMQQQVANATPPLLARAIATQILKYMKTNEQQSEAA
jgi:DNA (cytosine-5)-methyltransferase 1